MSGTRLRITELQVLRHEKSPLAPFHIHDTKVADWFHPYRQILSILKPVCSGSSRLFLATNSAFPCYIWFAMVWEKKNRIHEDIAML